MRFDARSKSAPPEFLSMTETFRRGGSPAWPVSVRFTDALRDSLPAEVCVLSIDSGSPDRSPILKGALVSGAINGVINGAIQWYLLADHAPLPLTVDGITNDQQTVFGEAVPLAVSLAMIPTIVAYTTLKPPKPPFYPTFLWMTVKHGFFALGVAVTLAVLWQRFFGSITVSLPTAVVILTLVAGAAATIVNYLTVRASLERTRGPVDAAAHRDPQPAARPGRGRRKAGR
jgi:hypothetical protein